MLKYTDKTIISEGIHAIVVLAMAKTKVTNPGTCDLCTDNSIMVPVLPATTAEQTQHE
jgi:hypothetical protein